MEFGGREIMILVGILVLIAIVLDVIRRVRRARYEKIRMPRRKQPIFDDEMGDNDYGSELPSGGARIVARRDDSDVEELSRSLKQIAEASKPRLSIFQQQEPTPEKLESAEDPGHEQPEPAADPEPEKAEVKGGVVVLHLMAEKGSLFPGTLLLQALHEGGMRYGEMNIFHCHDSGGEVLFSLANSVNPGTFELGSMSQFETPGVSLFFAMENLDDPVKAFEAMLSTAHKLVQRLGGDLCDETRTKLSSQTLEQLRDRIDSFVARRSAGVH